MELKDLKRKVFVTHSFFCSYHEVFGAPPPPPVGKLEPWSSGQVLAGAAGESSLAGQELTGR